MVVMVATGVRGTGLVDYDPCTNRDIGQGRLLIASRQAGPMPRHAIITFPAATYYNWQVTSGTVDDVTTIVIDEDVVVTDIAKGTYTNELQLTNGPYWFPCMVQISHFLNIMGHGIESSRPQDLDN
ncbi:hypothetical protein VNO77_42054 [Canavalia gladiata]|uniref:Uncharacterized protein n=1 Tax=Canavalia gladiata TaxID=3824 RepID=A0AAN9PSD6_CANGL